MAAATDLKSVGRKAVRVRVPLPAPLNLFLKFFIFLDFTEREIGIYMNTHWFKVFLVSLLLTICTVGGTFLTTPKTKSKNTALELQNFETKILDEHKQKLIEQGYEEVSYELNKIIQEMQKNNMVYRPSVNLNNSIEDTVIKKYDFYATYYKITIDDKDYIFKNKEKYEEFINNIQQYTNQKYEMATARLMVNKETSDEDLTNIIADKKAAYEKAKAEEEARKKAEEEARKQQEINKKEQNSTKNYNWNGSILTKRSGVNYGPSGKETYYNLPMDNVIRYMKQRGYDYKY